MREQLVLRPMAQRISASAVEDVNVKICLQFFVLFVLIWAARILHGLTNPTDGKNGFRASLVY